MGMGLASAAVASVCVSERIRSMVTLGIGVVDGGKMGFAGRYGWGTGRTRRGEVGNNRE